MQPIKFELFDYFNFVTMSDYVIDFIKHYGIVNHYTIKEYLH